jgi:hypothetical protein
MSPKSKKEKTNKQPQAAEFPDDTEITGGANYDFDDPTRILNPDPAKRYFFAAPETEGAMRPDGVRALKRKGYALSDAEHEHPDCVLMEIPRERYEEGQAKFAKDNAERQKAALRPPRNLEVVREDGRHGVGDVTHGTK